MLKFRSSKSMRSRRVAESQRKQIEDKLLLEWAWKPMAAVMNEKESDLVYWVPPLYTNHLNSGLNPLTEPKKSKNESTKSSKEFIINGSTNSVRSSRKRKLAQRRSRLGQNNNDKENIEINEINKNEEIDGQEKIKIKEGIKTELHEHNINEKTIKENEKIIYDDVDKKLMSNKEIPTLLKLFEKLSHLYGIPFKNTHNNTNKLISQKKVKSIKKVATNNSNTSFCKPKRPSVKIYKTEKPSNCSTYEKPNIPPKIEEEINPYYVITQSKLPFDQIKQKSNIFLRNKSKNNRTHISLPTMSETDLRNSHLEMFLRILTGLYDTKISDHNNDIIHLKYKIQTQEKMLKQSTNLLMDLKEQFNILQTKLNFNGFYLNHSNNDSDGDFSFLSLNSLEKEMKSGKINEELNTECLEITLNKPIEQREQEKSGNDV